MEIKVIDKNFKRLKEVEQIYKTSFPQNEQISFEEIKNNTYKNSKSFVFLNNKQIVGFCHTIINNNITYLFYFAIKEEERNKGFGTKALSLIQDLYKNNSIALITELKTKTNTFAEKRINFYETNGFKLLNFKFLWQNQIFNPMLKGKCSNEFLKAFLLENFPNNSKIIE